MLESTLVKANKLVEYIHYHERKLDYLTDILTRRISNYPVQKTLNIKAELLGMALKDEYTGRNPLGPDVPFDILDKVIEEIKSILRVKIEETRKDLANLKDEE